MQLLYPIYQINSVAVGIPAKVISNDGKTKVELYLHN